MSAWAGTRPEERTGARRPFRDAGSRPSALLRGRVGLRGVWPQQQAQVVADVARLDQLQLQPLRHLLDAQAGEQRAGRSEEHTSELQSLMRISYAVFCLKKKTKTTSSKTDYCE